MSKNRVAESILFFGFIGAVVAIPLIDWPGLDGMLLKDALFFLAVSALLLLWSVFTKGGSVYIDPQMRLIAVFLALVSIATLRSIHIPTSVMGQYRNWGGALSYVLLAFTYFLAVQIDWDEDRVKLLVRSMVYGGAATAALALLRFGRESMWLTNMNQANRASGSFVGPNILSFYLMLIWPLVLRLLFSTETKRPEKLALALAALMMFAANLFTASRTGLVLSVAMFLVVVFMSSKKKKLLTVVASFMVILALGGLYAGQRSGGSRDFIYNRAVSIFTAGSLQSRIVLWKSAAKLVRDRPLTGWGPDTYRLAFPRVESLGQAQLRKKLRTPHDYPLSVASGMGIPALLVLALIFFRAVKYGLAAKDYWRQTLSLALISAIVCGLTLEWRMFLLFFFWLLMGVILSPERIKKELPFFWPIRSAILILAVILLAWVGALTTADFYFQRGRHMPKLSPAKTAYLRRAVRLDPYAFPYWQRYFAATVDRPFSERLAVIRLARDYHPLQEETWFSEASLKWENKVPAGEVIPLVDRAISIRPLGGSAHLLKGKLLIAQKKYREAQAELSLAVTLLPQHPGDVKDARRALEMIRRR